jgi:hypothetical protein
MEGVGCSWDGVTGSTPQTGSDAACFNGHLGASVSGDWSGTESSGLQRPDILNSSGEDLSSLNNTSRSQHDALTMSRDGNSRETSVLSVQQGDISFVAGTAAYAPPLSTGSFADDLYSVGIVLYELLHLFKTSMQRATALRDLRSSGTVPASFRAMFPLESDMIEEVCIPNHCVTLFAIIMSVMHSKRNNSFPLAHQPQHQQNIHEGRVRKGQLLLRRDRREFYSVWLTCAGRPMQCSGKRCRTR